jgi:hypothetical protein
MPTPFGNDICRILHLPKTPLGTRPSVDAESRARREGRVFPGISPSYPTPAVTGQAILEASQQRLANYQDADGFRVGDQVRVRM